MVLWELIFSLGSKVYPLLKIIKCEIKVCFPNLKIRRLFLGVLIANRNEYF